jgi:hypothetical protein
VFNILTSIIGFFDRRFILAYWSPVAVASSALAAIVALNRGVGGLLKRLNGLDAFSQIVLAVAVVVVISVLAYVLQALTGSVVRLFEGYAFPSRLRERMAAEQRARKDTLPEAGEGQLSLALQRSARYWFYPVDDDSVAPTRLGNALAAAEEYPRKVYSADTALWWPRLSIVLPEEFAAQLDASLIPMIALLNLSLAMGIVAVAGGGYLFAASRGFGFVIPFLGGMLLAWMCYRAAVSQAVGYGNLIRVAFDYYRHDVIDKLGLPRPASLKAEHGFWQGMNQLAFNYAPPWQLPGGEADLVYAKAPADGGDGGDGGNAGAAAHQQPGGGGDPAPVAAKAKKKGGKAHG